MGRYEVRLQDVTVFSSESIRVAASEFCLWTGYISRSRNIRLELVDNTHDEVLESVTV